MDNLQSTLRSSGFNDQSVSEVMQAMQVLAKYNIMVDHICIGYIHIPIYSQGLGLGLGVAAMAQMRNSESAAVQQQNAMLNVPSAQHLQRYDVISHSQNNMLSGASLLDQHQSVLDQVRNA